MSGTEVLLVACQDAAPTFGRGQTAMVLMHGTDRLIALTDRLIALTDGRTRETPEASDVRH